MSGALARKDDSRGEPAARFLPEVPLARLPRPPLRLVWSAEGSDAPEALEPDAPAHLVAFHRGYMLGAAGEVEKAIGEFRRAIRLKPDHAEAHHNLGVMLGEADRNQEAIDAFVEAIRLKPAYAGAHRDLGVMLADSNEFLPAIASFREAIRLKPDDAQAHYDLGGAFEELGDWAAAIDAFREAIRLSPNDVFASNAYRSLGVALRRTSQLPAAIDAFRAGIALYDEYAPPHFYLGTALYEVGDIVGGIEAVCRAVQIRPTYAAAHFHLGVMFREFGQPEVAIDELLAAIRFGRNDEYRAEATASITEILQKQKEVSESSFSEYNLTDMDTSAAYAIVARDLGMSVGDLKKRLRAAADSPLARLQFRYEKRLREYVPPEDGIKNLTQARAAGQLWSTYRNLVKIQRDLGLEPEPQSPVVTEAQNQRTAFYRQSKSAPSRRSDRGQPPRTAAPT